MISAPSDKIIVAIGILVSWLVASIFIVTGCLICHYFGLFSQHNSIEVLAFSLLLPAISLAAGIGWAARTRHFVQNIDGSAPEKGSPLDLALRYVSNTQEQLLLFAIAAFCVSAIRPEFANPLLPVMGVWFAIARLLFYFGYRYKPTARAVGFAATFHPTLILYGLVLVGILRS